MRAFFFCAVTAFAASHRIAIWTASTHGPYPSGNPVAQPDLRGILDGPEGAFNQTFRLIVKPAAMPAEKMRLRFSNVFGTRPVMLDGVYVGLHASAGSIVRGTNAAVSFNGKSAVTIAPGELAYSDPVTVKGTGKLAVSFHVAGASGPMTWHAKAITTSYLSPRNSGSHGRDESSREFPFTTTSWFFLDAIDAVVPCAAPVVVGFGDSITDGTGSTINGDDRWPDFLAERSGAGFVVLNAGIGGNRVITATPAGGPAALERMDRDVLKLPGVTHVIWLEGINDLGSGASSADAVIAGFREGAAKLRARGIKVIGATIVSSLRSTPTHGTPEVDAARKRINDFIRNSGGVFDGVADFDAATIDAEGALKAEFRPGSSVGGPGDGLHPNRAGYQAMANAIDLKLLGRSGCATTVR